MILPASAGKFIYISKIYMILPAYAGKFIYISKIYMILPQGKKGYILYIWGLVGLYTAIQRLDLGFFSSSACGLGRKKSSVSGLYSCIQPSQTPYIHYIYIQSIFRIGFLVLNQIGVLPDSFSKSGGLDDSFEFLKVHDFSL